MLGETAQPLDKFIASECELYDDTGNNRFAFSLGRVSRYVHFLTVIEERYRAANAAMIAALPQRNYAALPTTRKLTEAEVDAFERRVQITNVLHLEIESFYLFAKILLDKVAHFLEDYFGLERSLSLSSHHKLCENLEAYSAAKGIALPSGFIGQATELQRLIGAHRDKQIAHQKNPRVIQHTIISSDGKTSVGAGYLYPKESDPEITESTSVADLVGLIDRYVRDLTLLISSNRGRSRFTSPGAPLSNTR